MTGARVASAAEFEHVLVAHAVDGGAFAPALLAALDRDEAFPTAACRVLDDAGVPAWYVPATLGGQLASVAVLIELWRAIARRDVTVAVAHGKTLLGAICVWLDGDPAQQAELARAVLAGGVVSWGLTERGHGSDLLAGELVATPTATGWRLDGEKWLINNATRGDRISVLARSEPSGGPRGFTFLLVDKARLAPGSYRYLAKERTHGIRGADISGIAFAGAELDARAVIGRPGGGLELVLKALQITRTACVGLSLGAAEHALGLAAQLAAAHALYDRRLGELPRARRTLGEAAAMLHVAEVVGAVGGRAVHALPGELSVNSAIVKALVPSMIDAAIGRLGELLGARSFFTGIYADGAFAKLERDHRIVAIFDGSTVVNRNALINQFAGLARAARARRGDPAGLAATTTYGAPLAALDPARLSLVSAGGCSVVQGVAAALAALDDRDRRGDVPAPVLALAQRLGAAVTEVVDELGRTTPSPREVPASAFALAARYELCFAGAACIEVWLRNADAARAATRDARSASALWRDALWLEAALRYVVAELVGDALGDAEVYDRVADVVMQHAWPTAYSLWSLFEGAR